MRYLLPILFIMSGIASCIVIFTEIEDVKGFVVNWIILVTTTILFFVGFNFAYKR